MADGWLDLVWFPLVPHLSDACGKAWREHMMYICRMVILIMVVHGRCGGGQWTWCALPGDLDVDGTARIELGQSGVEP